MPGIACAPDEVELSLHLVRTLFRVRSSVVVAVLMTVLTTVQGVLTVARILDNFSPTRGSKWSDLKALVCLSKTRVRLGAIIPCTT